MAQKLSSRMGISMMNRPLFPHNTETAFERRFQGMLRSAWQRRSWHVIVADPGSGKTMGIRDLIRTTGSPAGTLPGRSYPLLAVTAPKNDESEQALGNYLFTALRPSLRRRWSERKPKLMGSLVQFGVQCLTVDDAHDLSLEHLMFMKELTDQGCLHYDHPLGLCLVTLGRGNTMPLKEIFEQPETMWLQFRRPDLLQPFCRIAGHTSEEVREILAALETAYRDPFPHLNLRQWSTAIYTWLTHPLLDPTSSGRVTMDYLMKLVTTALEWSYQAGETEVSTETLQAAAELLTLRRDTIRMIDGAGPNVEAHQSDPAEQGSAIGTEPGLPPEHAAKPPYQQGNTIGTMGEQVQTRNPPKCTFSGVASIGLKRFLDSGIRLVECPDRARTRTLTPRNGVLRFPVHSKRKTRTPVTSQRWAMEKTIWEVVGGESK